ncbi:MAG TPA: glycosyltransferase family 4 protein, partial [Balneolales bacterium]|nr:glycosyltransferase family 4 protein [Balneolales bacterium]
EFYKEIDYNYIHLHFIEYPKRYNYPGHYLVERYQYSKRIFKELTKITNYDFIYIQGFSGWYTLKNKSFFKVPLSLNFHGYEMFQKAPDTLTWLKMQMFKLPVKVNLDRADIVYSFGGVISSILKNSLKIPPAKIEELPNGIERSWINNEIKADESVLKIVFIGRYERRKGIEELTSVLKALDVSDRIEYHLIGPIPDQKKIHRPDVIYYGLISKQENIKNILKSCDVLVCPSYAEGMPTVILEAMASGLAIIATDVGAVNQLVSSSNGWLIKGDVKNGLLKTINKVANINNYTLNEMKHQSIKMVENGFLWDQIIDQLVAIINTKSKNEERFVSNN